MPSPPRSDARPDPDALLARARRDASDAARGRLRIYFGASAGVGKTYAMLVAGRRLAQEGRDVVVGVVETHGRHETAALLAEGPDVGPALEVVARSAPAGTAASGPGHDEFDLDATLRRHPALVLVDELAHSNVAGARHPKRWQDVEELLADGIDVFTTLNVQHLESLNDIVGGITGVRVRETVPDTFFDRADEVILVDIPADELLERLAAGKVYRPAQAEHAARHFFRKGNLIALREIALRRTADRVEDDVQAYREARSIERVWATEASLLCCIGPGPSAERVVRSAARLSGQIDVGWHAIYVETPGLQKRSATERDAILRAVRLAEALGATTAVLPGDDVARTVARYAREHNLSRLVIGHASARGIIGRAFGAASVAGDVARYAPELDVIAIGRPSDEAEPDRTAPRGGSTSARADHAADDPVGARRRLNRIRVRYLSAALACAVVTAAAWPMASVIHPTNIAMLYLLTVTLAAMRLGRGPAVFASILAVTAFDFFFVPPRYSFAVADAQYLVTLGVMLTVALVIGTLGSNLRYQARVAAHREHRARSLYEVARDLSRALRTEDVVAQGRSAIASLFDAEVHVLLPTCGASPGGDDDRLAIDDRLVVATGLEPAIAQWAYRQSLPAGAGTDTLPGSPWLFLPLLTSLRARGVVAIRPSRRRILMIPEQRRLLETFATLVAIAIERVHYVEVAQDAVVRVESERLRSSILSALSHDLRTPLAVMAGLAGMLEMQRSHDGDVPLAGDAAACHGPVAAMRDEVERMSALVENLLDMARIESGDVRLNRQWHSIEETVGAALAATGRILASHRVEVALAPQLPLVEYDAVLIERVFVNLLENAAKYTPKGSHVRIEARAGPTDLFLSVADDGPGLPKTYDTAERIETLFEKFTRGERETPRTGAGLGLAICRAIVDAHGGSIHADANEGGGARFVVRLPRGEAPSIDEPGAGSARELRSR